MRHSIKRILGLLLCASLLFSLSLFFTLSTAALSSITADVSVGNGFMVALDDQGRVYAWGDNSVGILGVDTSTSYSSTPVQISVTGVKFKAVSAGFDHALAISSDGKVYAWGNNDNGQLGNENYRNHSTPTLVTGLESKNIVAVSAGKRFSLALSEDGKVYAFGLNDSLQLGIDGESESATPTLISALSTVFITRIKAGIASASAIDADGKLYLWGENGQSQLGGEDGADMLPTLFTTSKTTEQMITSAFGTEYSATLLADGTVGFMGKNKYGQYGNTATDSNPSAVFKITDTSALQVTSLAAAGTQTVLLGLDGTVYTAGQVLGSDDPSEQNLTFTPFFANQDSAPRAGAIAAGYVNGAFIAQDGSVWTWGDNSLGQLGNETMVNQSTPVRVCGEDGADFTLGSAPHVQQVMLMFSTRVPAPDFAVTIPSTIDVGELHQTTTEDPQRYSNTEFGVGVYNVQNLYGEKKIVFTVLSTAQDQTFYLSDAAGEKLPFALYLTKDGQLALENGDVLAEFTEDGSVTAWIRIDQSQILKSGIYTGTVNFYYEAVDIEAEAGGAS